MPINNLIEQLQDLIVHLRSQLEQVEAHVPAVNSAITRLAQLDLITAQTLLGDVVHTQSYPPETRITDSGLILQAALKIPGGLGIVIWDSEQYMTLRVSPDGLESESVMRFEPYDDLEPAIKALLLPQIEPLLDRVLRQAGAIARTP